MSLLNKAVLSMILQMAEDFFSNSTHRVGFSLRPFTNLLRIHGYHPTLYTVACSAGIFFGHTNVLLAKAHVETRKEGRKWGESKGAGLPLGSLFLLFLIFLHHNKDGGYNSTNINQINKELSPAQNTPALQAMYTVKPPLSGHLLSSHPP